MKNSKELSREIDIQNCILDKDLQNAISALFKPPEKNFETRSIDAILYIIEKILQNPYKDYDRIIDQIDYKSSIFSIENALKLLFLAGFEEGSSNVFLIFPYDRPINKLIAIKRILANKLNDFFIAFFAKNY